MWGNGLFRLAVQDPQREALDPWRLGALHQELDGLFRDLIGSDRKAPALRPRINLWIQDDGAVITAELPGVKTDDLGIEVHGDVLTLAATREATAGVPEDATWVRRERPTGAFRRTVKLPFRVEAGEVTATLRDGILEVKLPRAEADRPRRIAVRTGDAATAGGAA